MTLKKGSLLALALAATGALHAEKIEITSDHADALYRAGEEATFTVAVKDDAGNLVKTGHAGFLLDNFGPIEIKKGRQELAEANPFTLKGTLNEAGFLRLKVISCKTNALWGVGYDVTKIRQNEPCPADFDAYWASEKARLEREVPLDAKCELDEKRSTKAVNCYRVSFATFNNKRVYGFLAVPKNAKNSKLRLRVTVPGAGPGAVTANTTSDEIYLVMNVHTFEPAATIEEQKKLMQEQNKALAKKYGLWEKSYCSIAGISESREAYWYHDVMLGINRAVDWACARPDVDLSQVVYDGSSQGGGFGLFLNYLNSHFTKALVAVCAITGHYGYKQNRMDGWPRLITSQPKDRQETAAKFAGYFDGVNFAARIKHPIRFIVGFIDGTCPPSAVYAAYNACPSKDKGIINAIGVPHLWGKWYWAHAGKPECPAVRDWLIGK